MDLRTDHPFLTQETFDEIYGAQEIDLSVFGRLKRQFKSLKGFTKRDCGKWIRNRVPIFDWMRKYNFKENTLVDFAAGLTVGVMNIPQGMAYGMLTGLAPVYGLYTSFLPPLVYSIFGTSRHVSLGTFAIISLMVAQVVSRVTSDPSLVHAMDYNETFGNGSNETHNVTIWCGDANEASLIDPKIAVQVAVSLTFTVGIVQIILGVLNLGFLAVYLSDQLVEGLTTGAAIHVFSSQVSHVLGMYGLPRTTEPLGIINFYICLFTNIWRINWGTVVASAICIASLIVVKEVIDPRTKPKIKVPIPIELIMVIVATVISSQINLKDKFNISSVGKIPTGIRVDEQPDLTWLPHIFTDAITIAIVAFSIDVSIGKVLAKKHDYKIDANQEWFALGFAHVFSSFLSCHCSGASLSRSMLQSSQGGKTQVVSIVASGLILVVLLALANLFEPLPKCTLAAIIIVALKGLFWQFKKLPSLYRKSTIDFLIWIVTFTAVVLLEVSYGLAVGVSFALLTVVFRSQWPESVCLGRVGNTMEYKSLNSYAKAKEIPGVKIYRYDSPLYFANIERFQEELYQGTGVDPIEVIRKQKKRAKKEKQENKKKESIKPESSRKKSGREDPHSSVALITPVYRDGKKSSFFETVKVSRNEPPTPLHHIIIDCSSFPYVDVVAVEVLAHVYEDYAKLKVSVYFACCKVAVRQMFERCGFYKKVPKRCLFLDVHDAVVAALESHTPTTAATNQETSLNDAR